MNIFVQTLPVYGAHFVCKNVYIPFDFRVRKSIFAPKMGVICNNVRIRLQIILLLFQNKVEVSIQM